MGWILFIWEVRERRCCKIAGLSAWNRNCTWGTEVKTPRPDHWTTSQFPGPDPEKTALIHAHWNKIEIAWASLSTPGSQGCFVATTYLTHFHHRALSCLSVSVLIKLFVPTSGSSLNISKEATDPGEEESPWFLQGEEVDTEYDDVELSALETSIVTFTWCCIKYEMMSQIF